MIYLSSSDMVCFPAEDDVSTWEAGTHTYVEAVEAAVQQYQTKTGDTTTKFLRIVEKK